MQFSWVYITTNKRNGTLYAGVTSDLVDRIWKHKNDWFPGFSRKYGCKRLVWFETHHDIQAAIQREKRIKHWRRAWKLRLIEAQNPDWLDLYDDLVGWVPDNASGVSGMTQKQSSTLVIPGAAKPLSGTQYSPSNPSSRNSQSEYPGPSS